MDGTEGLGKEHLRILEFHFGDLTENYNKLVEIELVDSDVTGTIVYPFRILKVKYEDEYVVNPTNEMRKQGFTPEINLKDFLGRNKIKTELASG